MTDAHTDPPPKPSPGSGHFTSSASSNSSLGTPAPIPSAVPRGGSPAGSAWVPELRCEQATRPPWLAPLSALAVGLVITALIAWLMMRETRWDADESCRNDAARALADARARLELATAGIESLAAFVRLSDGLSPARFDAFAANVMNRSNALCAVAWAPIVTSDDLPSVEAMVRERAGADAYIWCPGEDNSRVRPAPQAAYAPLALVYPADANAPIYGLDLLAPSAAFPFSDALAHAGPTVSGPFSLAWLSGAPRGVFVTAPIANGPVGASGAAAGFILIDTILNESAAQRAGPHVKLEFAPGGGGAPWFAGVAWPTAPAPGAPSASPNLKPVYEETFNLAGTPLTIRALGDATKLYMDQRGAAWAVLAAGCFLSFLIAGFVSARGRAWRRISAQRRELQRVNSSLRDSEERFRLAVQAVDGIVYDWNAIENRAVRSGGLLARLGYDPGQLAPTLDAWLEVIHPDDVARVKAKFKDAMASGDAFSIEYRIRHKDGRYVDVLDRGVVIRGPDREARRIVGCTISLADQRRAEQTAQEAVERLSFFADAINDVLWTVELHPLRVVYLNPAFERVWGIPRENVYRDPEAWLAAIHPDDRQRVRDASRVWETPDSPRSRRLDYRIRRADGQIRWIQDTSVKMDDARGRPARVIGVAEDITERKQAQLDLQESEETYRQLFHSNLAVKLVFDPADGAIVQVNRAAVEFYGHSRERLQEMNIRDLCVEHAGESRPELERGSLPPPRFESAHCVAGGEVREVEVFSAPIQRKGRTLVYLLVHDISERKRIERDLEASRRTLEQAQAVGRIGSWVSDASPDGRLRWSSEVFRIFGIGREGFDERISTFFRYVHPDDVERVKDATAEAIRRRSVYGIEHRIVRPDGEIRWVLEQGEVEIGPDGAPARIVGVVQDVTERRQAEQALRDSQERLRATLDSLAEGCLVIASDGAFVECNRAAERILALSRETLLNRSIQFGEGWSVFREDGTPLGYQEYPGYISLTTGRDVDGMIIGLQDPFGIVRWISINSRPLRDAGGAIHGAVVSFADFSERRAAAISLQQTARRYQLLFDANPEPLWVYDDQTLRFLAVNSAAVETYGYSAEEFLARTILDIRPAEERERLIHHLPAVSTSQRLRATWVHQLKDGRLIDVEVISHPIFYEGRAARIVLAKDITERVLAERALRESEARLREAQRIGSFGDWEYDVATDRITWSDEVYALFRRDPALGPPRSFAENLHYYTREDAERLARAVRDAVEYARDAQIDLHVALGDGQFAWHRGVIRPVVDDHGRVIRLKGIVQDITERKLAEETLRATQLRLATVLEHLPDVVVYESDGNHIFPSDNMISLIGFSADEFVQDRTAFTRLVHPADLNIAERRIQQLRSDHAAESLVLQYRLRHHDGHYLWIEDRMVIEHPEHGEERLLGVLIDITERKRSEQRQRLMMAELDHRVKNNLATVISLLEQTGRTAKSQLEFRQTFLGRLQALARMHKALSRTRWEGVGLRSLVTQTLEAYQSDPPGRVRIDGVDVTLPARAASPVAMALHELATNAVKYGALSVPQGSVHVEWEVANDAAEVPHLSLRWTEAGGPPVSPPVEPGFGSELIQGGIAYELHGEVRIEFHPQGVRCFMNIPLVNNPAAIRPLIEEA